MGSLAASLVVMRWEMASAVMMFIASLFNVKCRQSSHKGLAFIFTGVGIGMSCWFVAGISGSHISMDNLSNFWHITKQIFTDVMSHAPADFPLI